VSSARYEPSGFPLPAVCPGFRLVDLIHHTVLSNILFSNTSGSIKYNVESTQSYCTVALLCGIVGAIAGGE
jgi:hypothetical protein